MTFQILSTARKVVVVVVVVVVVFIVVFIIVLLLLLLDHQCGGLFPIIKIGTIEGYNVTLLQPSSLAGSIRAFAGKNSSSVVVAVAAAAAGDTVQSFGTRERRRCSGGSISDNVFVIVIVINLDQIHFKKGRMHG
jgi:hypothetical protein